MKSCLTPGIVILAMVGLLQIASATPILNMSAPLGNEWFSNNTNFTAEWSLDQKFKVTKTFISGFSSGAILSTNIMTMDPSGFDGFGLLSGLLFSNFSMLIEEKYENFDRNPDLQGKQVFMSMGSKDSFAKDHFDKSVEYFKK